MDYLGEDLLKSLRAGFIDKTVESKNQYIPRILTNNKNLGVKVLSTIISELKSCDRFWFSVAFVTNSGVQTLIDTLKELEDKNIEGRILVSQYLNFTQPEALKRLLKFKNIKLKINTADNFHSKGYLFQNSNSYNLIVGSSNLTSNALCVNKELNLKVSASSKSYIIERALHEFNYEFDNSFEVNDQFIAHYEIIYKKTFEATKKANESIVLPVIPNLMQVEALRNLDALRNKGKSKALLISATGTGKTYLSAFDVKKLNSKKMLFVVHRENIAKAALETFKQIFGSTRTYGFFSGGKKDADSDFIFSTIQTISKTENLEKFSKEYFDYIVIDETHRAGANSYHSVLNYFKPKFLLGMTATPERTDGEDIFSLYDHNIAYEIRLQKALEENILSPFHYFGVSDIEVNGVVLDDNADFKYLASNERVNRIIEKIKLYSSDSGVIRGLVFCSRNDESYELSRLFNQNGFKSVALSGNSSDSDRSSAISRLESENDEDRLDYVFTVDIFNEGIDIPKVNQVIMLRPTQSAIIFVQQLGRGLRKADGKEYLTVIDFIGNYANNFMIPIALFGDTSYNKDGLRKLIANGSNLIPGTSTVNFDKISRDRIYSAIDSAKFSLAKDLSNDYDLLKYKIGKIPMMMDFVNFGSRDPMLYVDSKNSYLNYVMHKEKITSNDYGYVFTQTQLKLIELFSNEINNGKRIEESYLLKMLMANDTVLISDFKSQFNSDYGYIPTEQVINSCVRNLNFLFVTENFNKKMVASGVRYSIDVCSLDGGSIIIGKSFTELKDNLILKEYLTDSIDYALNLYSKIYDKTLFSNGFIKYQKYSRKDVFRILNWDENPVAQNVGGYIFNKDKTQCPIFVNYHKDDSISSTTKYEDRFINNIEFEWMSKSNRKLNSPEILEFSKCSSNLYTPLFIKKSNDEGLDFYYIGDLTPIADSFEQRFMVKDDGSQAPVVNVRFVVSPPVEDTIYNYLTNAH